MTIHANIAFIGAGNMTSAIVTGMVKAGYSPSKILLTNRSEAKLNQLNDQLGVHISSDNDAALNFANYIVLAVKPQMLAEVINALPKPERQCKKYISIAAGVTVSRIQEMLGASCDVVRSMPNTPSSVGMGMTGLYAQQGTDKVLCDLATYCLEQVGKTLWVSDEAMINSVIAAAGSAPAYLFLFAEAMQAKAEQLGFSAQDAKLLVAQTLAGSGKMLLEHDDISFSELRANVTSKGGTTAKAIESFQSAGLTAMVGDAMQAAVDRAEAMQELI